MIFFGVYVYKHNTHIILMVSITLSVPEELKKDMEKFPEINWSAVAREAIKNKITMLEKFRHFASQSSLTDKDALEFGRKIGASLAKKYKEA